MESIQYFKIILVQFLGNVIKMCSNFTYLIFSLSRLFLITIHKDLNQRKQPSKAFFVIYSLSLIIFSCLLSIFKLFQYTINHSDDTKLDFPFEVRDEFFCGEFSHDFKCKLINSFKIVNRSLNDVIFVLLNILVDSILIYKFKNHLDRKMVHCVNLDHRKSLEKTKKNVNRMILCNSFIYVLSHTPEFVVTFSLLIYSSKISNFCKNNFSCDVINEEAEFFGLISIVCQFYIFKIFDKNFRSSFEDIKAKLKMFRKN